MRIEIIMPKMGESITEGTIIKWHKSKGEHIKKDEILFEISTDKVDTEIPAQEDGIIEDILFKEGDTIAVGEIVAVLNADTGLLPRDVEGSKITGSIPEMLPPAEIKEKSTAAAGNLIEISMPKMGESVMEGTILRWTKKAGDIVKRDDILFEISTDKVDTEVPSPADGILDKILVQEQETVEVGTIVAILRSTQVELSLTPSEVRADAIDESVLIVSNNADNDLNVPAISINKEINDSNDSMPLRNSGKERPEDRGDRFYSPLVMNIAQKESVSFEELRKIAGTGIGGRITKNDLLQYIKNRTSETTPSVTNAMGNLNTGVTQKTVPLKTSSEQSNAQQFLGAVERVPMDNIRQKIMQHMITSRDTSVHVAGVIEVDMTRIYQFINAKKELFLQQEGVKLTYMSFISYATVQALREFPFVNASIDGNAIVQKRFVNLGIAVALEPNGLIVPNIKNAHEKNLVGLAKAITDIAAKSRNKKLTPDDISGGTFTITNYGVFGTLLGTPIINQPELAILGVGAVVKRAVVVEVDGMDTIAIKPMMYLTLSHDHRLVDGMLGGKFLNRIKDILQNFNEKSF